MSLFQKAYLTYKERNKSQDHEIILLLCIIIRRIMLLVIGERVLVLLSTKDNQLTS